jgi:mannose-6-phosphate isomerase-like protein (cupin superfamily)
VTRIGSDGRGLPPPRRLGDIARPRRTWRAAKAPAALPPHEEGQHERDERERNAGQAVVSAATSGRREVRTVPKPWGHETIWAHSDRYVGKILHIKAGHALSVQYHERKDETVYLLSGELLYRVAEQGGELRDVHLHVGEAFRIMPGTVHQMEAVTDCDVLEASTPELDDVVRLSDRYGREGTSAP